MTALLVIFLIVLGGLLAVLFGADSRPVDDRDRRGWWAGAPPARAGRRAQGPPPRPQLSAGRRGRGCWRRGAALLDSADGRDRPRSLPARLPGHVRVAA